MSEITEQSLQGDVQCKECIPDLRDEIAWFEQRLQMLGFNGDCAYERAMAAVYEQKIIELEQRLLESHLQGLP